MQSVAVRTLSDYDTAYLPDNLTTSPAACSSSSRTVSSYSKSLLCTEEDLGVGKPCQTDVLAKDMYPLWESRFDAVLLLQPAAPADDVVNKLGIYIRDDIRKQYELHFHRAASFSAFFPAPLYPTLSLPRRLPSIHRTRIVGWMRQVSAALHLHAATLFAATSLLDRFVGSVPELPPDTLLQLLALAAMTVGVKYEEVDTVPPSVWLSLAIDGSGNQLYQPADLQRMEWVLLQAIDWRLHTPNTHTFLTHFLACMQPPTAVATTATTTPAAEVAASTAPEEHMEEEPHQHPGGFEAYGMRRPLEASRTDSMDTDSVETLAYATATATATITVAALSHPPQHPLRRASHPDAADYHDHDFSGGLAPRQALPLSQPPSPAPSGREMEEAEAATKGTAAEAAGEVADGNSRGCMKMYDAAVMSPRGAASAAAAAEALGLLWWRPVADMAMMLAETSLMHETFLSYEHSTVALACVVLAEHKLCPPPAAARLLPACTRAVAAVCGASGLTLQQLAPGLEGCVEALDRCYGLLGSSGELGNNGGVTNGNMGGSGGGKCRSPGLQGPGTVAAMACCQ
ncbi:hypothetical protein Agub_g6545 [Astrephomene gubernaculifera]|uniref:Cyclin-like domain-containing protein n=1 Tax=Astrephomene gubernaculifera TaxID=47775 RepID=A0AAD3DNJ1_9CHLO|nr:hypothetical protein Agub_g6545 [Astrephomene gubernaculifera]